MTECFPICYPSLNLVGKQNKEIHLIQKRKNEIDTELRLDEDKPVEAISEEEEIEENENEEYEDEEYWEEEEEEEYDI